MRIFCLICLVFVSFLNSADAQENISTGNAEDNSAVVAGSDGVSDSAESAPGNGEDEQKALRTSYFTRVRAMFFVLLVCAITLPWIVFRRPSTSSSDA
jgi:hypothetical protein